MRLIFIFILFFNFSAFADFKNELPSNFPGQVSPEGPASSSQKTKGAKNGKPGSNSIKPVPANKNEEQTQASPPPSSPNNEGAFGSELGNHDSNAPVFFSGNHGNGSRLTGILNLIGNAVIIQDDTTLKSNKAQIFSLPGTLPAPGTSRIQRAIATGNVRIFKKETPTAPEIKATGNEAEFIVPIRILILKGKAKVWRKNEYLNGDTIKISLNTGDIEIISPEGTIDPRSANNNFNNKTNSPKK